MFAARTFGHWKAAHFRLGRRHESFSFSSAFHKLQTMKTSLVCIVLCIAGLMGCSTAPNVERGPQGTIAYYVQVESSEPGVGIEANNDYVGKTPCILKIFGDTDGTFHNFGSYDYVVRAFPTTTNQYSQSKVFRTGGWFSQEDRIPSRIFFDMNQKPSSFSIDLPPRY